MPLPTRPVSGATIAATWGQTVHDWLFAPAGCLCSGGIVEMLAAAAWRTLPIDTAVQDPGGYVDTSGNRLVVPADGGGLYQIFARVGSDEGDADETTRIRVLVNGAELTRRAEQQQGGTTITLSIDGTFVLLEAGDVVTVQAQQAGGSGDRAEVEILSLAIIRIGDEFGAP